MFHSLSSGDKMSLFVKLTGAALSVVMSSSISIKMIPKEPQETNFALFGSSCSLSAD